MDMTSVMVVFFVAISILGRGCWLLMRDKKCKQQRLIDAEHYRLGREYAFSGKKASLTTSLATEAYQDGFVDGLIQVHSASDAVRARVTSAEKEVRACLNYGGIYFDHDEVCSQKLILDYESGDLADEVALMRRLASALNNLADSLEEKNKGVANG